jgi:hypothetical protein
MKVNARQLDFTQSCQVIHSLPPPQSYLVEMLGGSEGVMPYRVNSLLRLVFAGSLAAAVLFGPNWTASAASGCSEKPDLEVTRAGHWYYYVDRVNHRRCWYFEPSEATASPPSSADRAPAAPNADSQQSWFSRFAADVAKTFSSEPRQSSISAFSSEQQQNSILDNSSTVTKLPSPKQSKSNKIVSRERSQIESPPTTNGVSSAERRDQLPSQRTGENDEKRTPQLTASDRETLFNDFLKWYMDKGVFGRP